MALASARHQPETPGGAGTSEASGPGGRGGPGARSSAAAADVDVRLQPPSLGATGAEQGERGGTRGGQRSGADSDRGRPRAARGASEPRGHFDFPALTRGEVPNRQPCAEGACPGAASSAWVGGQGQGQQSPAGQRKRGNGF